MKVCVCMCVFVVCVCVRACVRACARAVSVQVITFSSCMQSYCGSLFSGSIGLRLMYYSFTSLGE